MDEMPKSIGNKSKPTCSQPLRISDIPFDFFKGEASKYHLQKKRPWTEKYWGPLNQVIDQKV